MLHCLNKVVAYHALVNGCFSVTSMTMTLYYHLGDLFHRLPLLDVLHDQLVKHLLLDVLHDHLVKHLLLPIHVIS